MNDYGDVLMAFYLIKGPFEDNKLDNVIKELKEISERKEIK
jgi:hypothetical protein